MPGTVTGQPARIAICRAMFQPVAPSGFAQPMIRVWPAICPCEPRADRKALAAANWSEALRPGGPIVKAHDQARTGSLHSDFRARSRSNARI